MKDKNSILNQMEKHFIEYNLSAINCREADLDAGDPHGTLAIGYQLQALTLVLEMILIHLRIEEDQ